MGDAVIHKGRKQITGRAGERKWELPGDGWAAAQGVFTRSTAEEADMARKTLLSCYLGGYNTGGNT
jgi:hypothetical protein